MSAGEKQGVAAVLFVCLFSDVMKLPLFVTVSL